MCNINTYIGKLLENIFLNNYHEKNRPYLFMYYFYIKPSLNFLNTSEIYLNSNTVLCTV